MVVAVFVVLHLTAEVEFVVHLPMVAVGFVAHLLMVAVAYANLLERRDP